MDGQEWLFRQDAKRKLMRKDLEYFYWVKRDFPQINGMLDVVDSGSESRWRKACIMS
ncbi:MAG: hypothetical protein PHV34_15490 [Verrucomicrobiae bacterium]|nr:hypothetical protein [Verrucomicrobiae bacterium]